MSKNFCFTIYSNSWEPELAMFKYIVWQKEKGKKLGHLHYQGFCQLKDSASMLGCKRKLGDNAHVEEMMGTVSEARAYCMKEDTRVDGPWEHGVCSYGQGDRTDLESCKGKTLLSVANEQFGTFVRCHRGLERARDIVNRIPEREPWTVVYGEPPEGAYYIGYKVKQIDEYNLEHIYDWSNYDYQIYAACDRIVPWERWVGSLNGRGLIPNKCKYLYVF